MSVPGATLCDLLTGPLTTESLRIGADLAIPDLQVVRLSRHDVSRSTAPDGQDVTDSWNDAGATADQPQVWAFLDFTAPDERADDIARAIADALESRTGWYADFVVGADHVVVFAGRIFRYRIGDKKARQAAVAWGRAAGTPEHQLDWGD